jgi:hypothetical protein
MLLCQPIDGLLPIPYGARLTKLEEVRVKQGRNFTRRVIAAIVSSMDAGDNARLADLKTELASINLKACADDAEKNCNTAQNGRGYYKGGLSIYDGREGCVRSIYDSCRDDQKQHQTDIEKFQYRSRQYAFTVVKTNNYEGNVISYVDLRAKGTDEIERDKITLQLKNNAWKMVDSSRVPN